LQKALKPLAVLKQFNKTDLCITTGRDAQICFISPLTAHVVRYLHTIVSGIDEIIKYAKPTPYLKLNRE
jgi:hypothetical protein